ncbi:MAG: GSCFA domain protein [Bacteroidetes bacterium B1(2017)]|nr:MAG: GSCFA domain protein [Bacteroidetes bacterium B1(2017)]
MQFRLEHTFKPLEQPIAYSHKVFALGSCFAQNIGQLLQNHRFNLCLNPSGILFNPASMAQALAQYINPSSFHAQEQLIENQGLFHSWSHHGQFSNPNKAQIEQEITNSLQEANKALSEANYLLLTWGSAWVYELNTSKQIVANCHKVPANQFTKRLLRVEEIVALYTPLLTTLLNQNKDLKIIWSISPVKYSKDGLHQNNLSKSVLFLALNQLQQLFPTSYYFPAFELVQDELRDYRFYGPDMAHPNQQAIDYVWEQFKTHCIEPNSLPLLNDIAHLNQALLHRPLHEGSEEFVKFKKYIQEKSLEVEGRLEERKRK